jgi:hypothetical protein
MKVRMKHNMQGIGVYWCLVEMLHEENGQIKTDVDTIAYELRVDVQVVKDVIDLCFTYDDNKIISERVIKNLEYRKQKREEKSKKGKEAAQKRWNIHTKPMGYPLENDGLPMGDLYQTHGLPMDDLYQTYGLPIPNHAKEKAKAKEKEKDIIKTVEVEADKASRVNTDKPFIESFFEQRNELPSSSDILNYLNS